MAPDAKPILETPRLRLRAVTLDDATDLCSLDADAEVRRFLDQPTPPTLEEIRLSMIPRWQSYDIRTPAVGYWVAVNRSDARFLGWFHLRPPKPDEPLRPDDLELGYRLRRDCWGAGLATEGGAALLRYAFEQLGSPRVAATALRGNTASVRVMEKLGLSLDCQFPYKETVAVAYAITAARWQQCRDS